MEKIHCILVDDEQHAIDLFKKILVDFSEIEVVGTASNVNDGIRLINDFKPDLVFLDIQMPGKGGFELLHEIRDFEYQPCIIFVTAFDHYAIDAIRHSVFDYITKPIDPFEISKAIQRFKKEFISADNQNNITDLLQRVDIPKVGFKSRTGITFIDPDQIFYIKAEGNYSEIFMVDGRSEMVSLYLADVQQKLTNYTLLKINRSAIINPKYLTKIDRKRRMCVLACDNTQNELKIAYRYLKQFSEL